MRYSKTIGVVVLATFLGAGLSTSGAFAAETDEPIRLEGGSYVFIDEEGTTRMVDRDGKPVKMREDVEMRTADGDVIIMRNNRVWKLIGPPGKKRRASVDS